MKEVIQVLVGVLSSTGPSESLPEHAQEVIRLYLDRHRDVDEQDAQRLQDELLNLHQKLVAPDPSKLPDFLAALRHLRPAIRGEERLMEWWKRLVRPTVNRLSPDSALGPAARDWLLAVLVYDDDDDDDDVVVVAAAAQDAGEERARISERLTQEVLDLYLETTSIPGVDHEGDFAIDDRARLIGHHLESVLVEFGRKRPKVKSSPLQSPSSHQDPPNRTLTHS